MIQGEDGIDHINVYSKGQTKIGRWLSNFTYSPILTIHGKFNSIEGYWGWLKSENEDFRILSGIDAKRKSKKIVTPLFRENFNQLIKDAIDIKLKTYPKKKLEFSKTSLPFEHYYVYGDQKKDVGYKWILKHLELRRNQLKKYYDKNSKI